MLQILKVEAGGVQVGYTVSAKVGNAVERNRIKRRLRAAAIQVIPQLNLENYHLVLIGRRGALKIPYANLLNDLRRLVKKLVK